MHINPAADCQTLDTDECKLDKMAPAYNMPWLSTGDEYVNMNYSNIGCLP